MDRVQSEWTPLLFLLLTSIICTKQYFGAPIQCMAPAEFKGDWKQYMEDYCFITHTYKHLSTSPMQQRDNVDNYRDTPMPADIHVDNYINYYQWVPFMLIMQAFFFSLPHLIWHFGLIHTGSDLPNLVAEAKKYEDEPWSPDADAEEAKKQQEKAQKGMLALVAFANSYMKGDAFSMHLRGTSITLLYALFKLVSLINAVAQFFLLNRFLGANSYFWGFDMLAAYGDDVQQRNDQGVFPLITWCTFQKREWNSVQQHTVQCVLMINMLNEKFFLIIWFWLILLIVGTFLHFVYLLVTMVSSERREAQVRRYLRNKLVDHDDEMWLKQRRLLRSFVHELLQKDGCLMLRFVEDGTRRSWAKLFVSCLWADFQGQRYTVHPVEELIEVIDGKVIRRKYKTEAAYLPEPSVLPRDEKTGSPATSETPSSPSPPSCRPTPKPRHRLRRRSLVDEGYAGDTTQETTMFMDGTEQR